MTSSGEEDFIRRHWAFAHRWAAHRLRTMGDRADPAAVTSDALLGVLRAAKTWAPDGGRAERSWVLYCVDHAIVDGARQRYGDSRYQGKTLVNRWTTSDDAGYGKIDPYPEVVRRLDVARALKVLKPRERRAVEAYYWDELPLHRVGALVGVSESGASLMLKAARLKMRRVLT